MKTRMVLIAAAVLLFACSGFAQQGFVANMYTEYQLRASTPTGCDNGEPLPDGTMIEIRWDQNNSGAYEEGTDPLAPLCDNPPGCATGPAGTVNYNTFPINSQAQGMAPGNFYTDVAFTSVGQLLPNQRFFLVIRCSDGSVHYVSAPVVLQSGGSETAITVWNCTPCATIQPCTPSNDVAIHAQGSDVWNISNCLHLCPNSPAPVLVYICSLDGHPLDPTKTPVSSWVPGCLDQNNCFDPNCPPTQADVVGPVYDPASGCFIYSISAVAGTPEGCICFTFEHFLAVGFNNDFQAVASDGAVNLSWSTSSEVGMARYDIIRGTDKVGEVSAANAAHTYNYVDESAANGTSYTYKLRAVNMDGTVSDLGNVEATPSFGAAVITEYALHQNFPNPFNPTTEITFDVVEKNLVSLKVFNAAGQVVATVANGEFEAGRHIVSFNASNLPSGLYFYSVKIGNDFSATKKMLLVK